MRNALFLLLFLFACGGAQHAEHEEHHDEMAPAVRDFHDTLAPLWHAPKGPERVTKTCDSAPTLQAKAKATNDADLAAATDALAAECAKEGRPDVEAKLAAVHARFHALMEK